MLCFTEVKGQEIKLLHNLSPSRERADHLYEKGSYHAASKLYIKAFKKDSSQGDLVIKIGECYRLTKEYSLAEHWYSLGLNMPENNAPKSWMRYAQLLITNNKHEEAKEWLKKYNTAVDDDLRVKKNLNALDNLHFHFKDSGSIQVRSLSINSEHMEFSPVYYNEGILFLSNQHTTDVKNAMNWSAEEYVNIYYTEEKEDGSMQDPIVYDDGLGSSFHSGPLVFYGSNKVIFTRTGVLNKKTAASHLELYEAEYDSLEERWVNVTPLPFNSEKYSVSHPAIKKNGEVLIFASNMPGGIGKTDLYRSRKVAGQWGAPENLGAGINSEGDDMFPYFITENEMVFASDGHGGLGDLDLFRINLSEEPQIIENLGYPFSSPQADFGYVSNDLGTTGYFTSNRKNKGLDDDIYHFVVNWEKVQVKVVDKASGIPLSESKLELSIDEKVKDVRFTDSTGTVQFITLPNGSLKVEVSKNGYLSSSFPLTERELRAEVPVQLALEKVPIAEEKAKSAQEILMDQFNAQKALVQVNGRIFEYREIGNYQYLVNADEQVLLSKELPNADQPLLERARNAIEANGLRMEESYSVKNIYFDLNSAKLSEAAISELDKVVRIMTTDQKIAFEIVSFTDSRGEMAFNDELAFKRSQTIARHLIAKDISGSRLILDSYGEQGQLNDCNDDKQCSELYYAVNRRSEFKLVMRKLHKN